MDKRIQHRVYLDENTFEVAVVTDMNDVEVPIGFRLTECMDHTIWMTEDDAKQIIKAFNAALRELK